MAGVRAEEEEVSQANLGISIMLLGSIGFMMSLFYLTNLKDKELRKYSWQVISSTISIFSAVLLFQACNGFIENLFLEGASEMFELLVAVLHMLVWFAILQFALAFISGALAEPSLKKAYSEEDYEKMELNLKCYAVLLGHITGFSAINAFATFQQVVPRDSLCVFLVAPLAWGCVYMVGRVTDGFRNYTALGDDGEIDEAEHQWDDATEETEDDVVGLAVSFVAVQWLRFFICGWLPNEEGEEPEEEISSHSNTQVVLLMTAGFIFEAANTYRTLYIKTTFERLTPQMRNITAMVFSWCLFFSSDWWLSATFFTSEHGMIKQVVLAMFITVVALALIFILDKVEDLQGTDAKLDNAIRAIILALSILIGFSWERAFDTAVVEITSETHFLPHAVTKLILAVILAAVVIPAWRMHILPTIVAFEEEEKAAEKREEVSSLEQPLLEATVSSAVGLSGAELERRYKAKARQTEQLKAQLDEVKGRNGELEETIIGISAELSELQKLADHLSN